MKITRSHRKSTATRLSLPYRGGATHRQEAQDRLELLVILAVNRAAPGAQFPPHEKDRYSRVLRDLKNVTLPFGPPPPLWDAPADADPIRALDGLLQITESYRFRYPQGIALVSHRELLRAVASSPEELLPSHLPTEAEWRTRSLSDRLRFLRTLEPPEPQPEDYYF